MRAVKAKGTEVLLKITSVHIENKYVCLTGNNAINSLTEADGKQNKNKQTIQQFLHNV